MGASAVTSTKALVVVGAGPAGLGAAIEAARAGLPCTLLDEAAHLGGQIYRPLPPEFRISEPRHLGRDFERGERLRREFATVADRVEVISGAAVFGLWDSGREVAWTSGHTSTTQSAERLVLATGAYERPVPFPGWTLPGVITAGGAQTLVKTLRIRPGRRALVAGTGPLLLVVANQLHEAGVEVAAVLEAGRPSWSPTQLPSILGEWELMRDAWEYWRGLRRARIPLLFNHTIFEAHGTEGVTAASYGPVDAVDWTPRGDRAVRVDVDHVVVGFGFVPNTQLTESAGCRHEYVHELGGWVPVRNEFLETTIPGLFAVGDGAGVAGSVVALQEGRVAGITAAQQAGVIDRAEADLRRAGPLKRLQSLSGVRRILDRMSRMRPGLSALATPDTLVCRCEEVALREVNVALAQGARDLQAVKLLTRLGMGQCQGRNCAPSTAMIMSGALSYGPASAGRINPRPPVSPVTLGALANMRGATDDLVQA
jgi:hydrogen cyanide synthase HcnB